MKIPLTPVRFLRYAEQQFPNRIAVVCGDQRFTYAQFADRANRLAGALGDAGVGAGDRVAFLSMNCHRLLEAYYGVLAAGAVLLPLNFRLASQELAYILNDAEAKLLFLEQDFVALVDSFRQGLSTVREFIMLDAPPRGAEWLAPQNYDQMLSAATAYAPDVMEFDEDSLAELFYTSGTSANPKGVMLTHRNVYLHALYLCIEFNTNAESVQLHTIPLFHANGWGVAHTVTFVGGKHVMLRKFICTDVFRLVQQERVRSLNLVPVMASALVNSPDVSNYDLSSLEWISIGGAASSPTLLRQVEEKLGCECFSGYGLTETGPVLSTARLKRGEELRGQQRYVAQAMTGYAIPGAEIRVVDGEGRDVPRDGETMGEVVTQADGVMEGYWAQPDATAAAMEGGWFHTGDMAVLNPDGTFLIVDRKKDIIVSGGENISSLEVEKVLVAHPDVYEAAVIPVPDEKWGEVPKALVVRRPESSLSPAELIQFCSERLAHFKCPRSVDFVDSLPKTATGKVLKKNLRRAFWESQKGRSHAGRR